MDPKRFDSLIHGVGKAQTRRRALAAFLAGIAGPFLPGFVAEADRKKRKGHGNGRGTGTHKARRKDRDKGPGKGPGKGHSRKKQEGSADDGTTSKAAKDCRPAEHPCEGNQDCCNSDRVICVASGPGAAARCTPCPDGQIACANACIPTCIASDQCHVAGECDPTSGACTDPRKPDGASCDDGDACTRTDTCQDGVCVGRNPVDCAASDDCHIAGECDPRTGKCSNPEAEDGTSCDDGNACTQRDICQAGECVGRDPVQCAASDQCHAPGQCDPETGRCSNPTVPDGTACDDGNACTTRDVCRGGDCVGTDVVQCAPSDDCHAAGECDPESGTCSNPQEPDGTACGTGGTCSGGVCQEICLPYRSVCPDDDGPCCADLQCRAVSLEPPPFVTGRCLSTTCKDALESCSASGLPCCASGSTCQPAPLGGSICCSPPGGPCNDFGSSLPSVCCGANVCNGSNTCAACRQIGESCDGIGIASNCCNTPFSPNPVLCDRGVCVQ